jgi:hypothetical protein
LKRTVTDVIRRGFANTIANWPLLLIRIGESAVAFIIVIATLLAAVVPVIVTALHGSGFDFEHPDRFLDLVLELVTEHSLLIAWLVVLASLVLGLILAVRSFVEAGTARIFFDGEAAEATTGKFAAFDVQRWFDGGKQSWWPVFVIYNIIGLYALLAALVPVILVAMAFMVGGSGSAVLGCLVLPLVCLSLVAMAIIAALWNQKAIVVCVDRGLGGFAAVRAGWRELMDDFPRHLAVGLLIALISFGSAALLSVMSIAAGFGRNSGMTMAFAPMQMLGSFAQTSVSAIAGTWFIACFVALTSDNRS